jgi:hypothetical protein
MQFILVYQSAAIEDVHLMIELWMTVNAVCAVESTICAWQDIVDLLYTGMQEGHRAHQTWFMRDEERKRSQKIICSIPRSKRCRRRPNGA